MTDEAPVEAASATPSTETPAAPAAPSFSIPDAHKEKPWAAKIQSSDDMWKIIDNNQALIGKKIVVPDFEKADPKEIEEYIGQLRPKDKTAYKFADDVPEAERTAYSDMLLDVGIPAYQANKLIEKYMGLEKAKVAEMYDKDGFMAELKSSFGDDYEKVSGEVAKTLAANLSADDKQLLERVPNKFLGIIYRAAASLNKAYGATESGAQTNTPPGQVSEVNLEKRASELRNEIIAITNKPHTAEEKQRLVDELNSLYNPKR